MRISLPKGDPYLCREGRRETTIHTRFSSIHTWVKPACQAGDENKMKTIVNCNIAYFVEEEGDQDQKNCTAKYK